MEILKQFEKATIEEIEAYIQDEVNKRDALNVELVALNHLRDRKVKEERKRKAIEAFRAEHGEHPDQVITMEGVVSGGTVKAPTLWDGFKSLFGGKPA